MCIFCKIVKGEIPSNKVLENSDFLAFHDISPRAPVHVLIIPKKHVENFQEVDAGIMSKATEFIQQTATTLGVGNTGYRLITNCGKDSGQEVMHLHFHLLGGLKLAWDHKQSDPKESF